MMESFFYGLQTKEVRQLAEILKESYNRRDKKPFTVIATHKVGRGRNDLCQCGSGLKYKKCCLNKR